MFEESEAGMGQTWKLKGLRAPGLLIRLPFLFGPGGFGPGPRTSRSSG